MSPSVLRSDKVKTMSNNSFADQVLISWVNIKSVVCHYLILSHNYPHMPARDSKGISELTIIQLILPAVIRLVW